VLEFGRRRACDRARFTAACRLPQLGSCSTFYIGEHKAKAVGQRPSIVQRSRSVPDHTDRSMRQPFFGMDLLLILAIKLIVLWVDFLVVSTSAFG
jgi:hypothetical protein